MSPRPHLSKSELEVARLVWDRGEATVRQVLEAMPDGRKQLDYKTVQTYLRRLEAKGYLRTKREGRGIVYSPRVRPAQVIRETIEDFLRRLFDGEALPLAEYLIQDHGFDYNEIAKLRAMLDEADEKRPDSSQSRAAKSPQGRDQK